MLNFNQKQRSSKTKKIECHRATAFLLSLVLLLTSPSLPVAAIELSGEPEWKSEVMDEQPLSGNSAEDEVTDTEETENGESSGEKDSDSDDSGEAQPADPEGETEAEENAESSLSENTLSENSISENSLSENDLGDELALLIRKAEESFGKLVQEKQLMALLYHCESYDVRSEARVDSAVAAAAEVGTTLYIHGLTITEDDVWYQVSFWQEGGEKTGYVQSYYLAYSDEDWRSWEEEYLRPILEYREGQYGMTAQGMTAMGTDTSDIDAFPSIYQKGLRALKADHANWTFVPMKTGLDFNTSVQKEMGVKSLIQNTNSNAANGWVGAACPSESGWYYATQSAVEYHLNPVNFLSLDHIFMFEQLTFNSSYHNVGAVQSFLDGTFMKGKIPDDTKSYAQAFYDIGKNRKLSPIHLASRVYQEQGKGTSGLISGTYPGFEGYYNYFNIKASGSSTEAKIKNGLTYAKQQGWNTRYKSLEGGAGAIGNNYILKGQDTIYLEKFNVNTSSPYGVYEHQYMQNIQAPRSEGYSTKKMYDGAGSLNSPFVFKIPVFNKMPGGSGLVLKQKNVKLNRGDSTTLSFTYDDVAIDNAKATWISEDATIASVKDGVVTGEKVGTTRVTMTYVDTEGNESSASCEVTVVSPLKAIHLSRDGKELEQDSVIVLRRPDTVVEDDTVLSEEDKKNNTKEARLEVLFDPEDTTDDRTIVWTSSNPKVVKVQADADSSRCTVTAVGTGEATIKAKASKAGSKATVSCKIQVTAPVYRVALTNLNDPSEEAKEGTLYAGQKVSLAAEYWPKDTTSDTKVSWGSSDPSVAVVTGGTVTAKKAGEAVITASLNGYQDSYQLTVRECSLIFMDQDNKTVLQQRKLAYGESVTAAEFPAMEDEENAVFVGWYTKPDGGGTLCDTSVTVYAEETVLYPYFEEQGKGFYVVPVGDQTYTGSAIKPAVKVYDAVTYADGTRERIELVYNKDYTVSYKNNVKVTGEGGKLPTITVTGKGNYGGKETLTFQIVPKALTDKDIEVPDIKAAYTGRVVKPAPVVTRNGKKLKANTDYTVTYPQTGTGAYQKVGTYPVVITGKGGYTGTLTIHQTITQEAFLTKAAIGKIPNQTYDNRLVDKEAGKGIEPETLVVTYQRKRLEESTDGGVTGDYTVSYTNNLAIGTATATITAVEGSGFTGSKSVTYKIVGTSLTKAKVTGIEDKVYTGEEADVQQNPGSIVVTLNGQELVQSQDDGRTGDYVIAYANVSKVGRATIILKGVNEYTGQVKKTYKITARDLGDGSAMAGDDVTMAYYEQDQDSTQAKEILSVSDMTAAYVKGGTKPVLCLTYRGKALTLNKDYKVSYANNNAVTSGETPEKKMPKITVTGVGNYKGKIVGTFTITDGALSAERGKVVMTAKDVVYKNKKNAYRSAVVIRDVSGKNLQAGKDFEKQLSYTYEKATAFTGPDGVFIERSAGDAVEAADIPEAGTVIRVTAKGAGAYAADGAAAISTTYRIVKADLAKAKISVKAQEYQNGRPVTVTEADITVTMPGSKEPLVCGVDYVIDQSSYANNTKKGTASVMLRGLDGSNYGGEKKATFKILSKTLAWWRNLGA